MSTLTKEQLKHAFKTVPDGCVVIMEPSTVLKEGDYWMLAPQPWTKADGLIGSTLKQWNIQLAARPITPTPPKGYYLIYNPEEILKEGDLYLNREKQWATVKYSLGESIAIALSDSHIKGLVRPANFSDLKYDAITTFESPPKPEKETIIEPIQFSIEHL